MRAIVTIYMGRKLQGKGVGDSKLTYRASRRQAAVNVLAPFYEALDRRTTPPHLGLYCPLPYMAQCSL